LNVFKSVPSLSAVKFDPQATVRFSAPAASSTVAVGITSTSLASSLSSNF